MPVGTVPAALHGMAHADGECATARAAAAAGVVQVVSTVASRSIEDAAAAARRPRWFQLYVQRDRAISRDLVQRAEAAGYGAIALTVDLPVLGYRDEVLRTDFDPGRDAYANLPKRAVWDGDIDEVLDMRSVGLTWDDLASIRGWSSLPLVLKGILTAEDARLAVEHGRPRSGSRTTAAGSSTAWQPDRRARRDRGRRRRTGRGLPRRRRPPWPRRGDRARHGRTRGVRRPPVHLRCRVPAKRALRTPWQSSARRRCEPSRCWRARSPAELTRTHVEPVVGFRRYPQVDDDRAARRSVARRAGGRAGHRNRRRPPCRDGRAGRAGEPPLPRRGRARDQRRRIRPAVPRAGRARASLPQLVTPDR